MGQPTAEDVIRFVEFEKDYWVCWEIMCACCKRFPDDILEEIRTQVRAGATCRQAAASFKTFRVCCINLLANPAVICLSGTERYSGHICKAPFIDPTRSLEEPLDTQDPIEAFLAGEDPIEEKGMDAVELPHNHVGGSLYIDPLLDLGGKITWDYEGSNTYYAN